ncbi:SCO2400 family protein [Streptomyces ureilyticus]|jgi:hypothetical protein|uniref:Uncharacterized protein n=1 Tax=Streptomyces ureilyticus TaxID=1775131 RepID=A0ABX0DXZ8_9ACTN|nr:hypothetical protein [Streptomyces ureilyticus]NGO45515.1 hypothetical protein [Streptomyces ureilyticus]
MDYCSSCHRHLNGALVCPGCGAYAPDIAPPAIENRALPKTTDTAVTETSEWFTAPRTRRGSDLRAEAPGGEGADEVSHTGPSGGLETPSQGRAARRRQLARWKKNKRRAVVATAVALVGGGLTVATLDRPSTERAQAATAPDDTQKGAPEKPAAPPTLPTPTAQHPDTHRSSRTTPPARPPAADLPRQQSPTPARRTTRTITRPDAAAPAQPAPTATSDPRPGTDSPPAAGTDQGGNGGTADQPSSPPATDGTGGTDSGTSSQPSTSPTPTPPGEICLLVVCLG